MQNLYGLEGSTLQMVGVEEKPYNDPVGRIIKNWSGIIIYLLSGNTGSST